MRVLIVAAYLAAVRDLEHGRDPDQVSHDVDHLLVGAENLAEVIPNTDLKNRMESQERMPKRQGLCCWWGWWWWWCWRRWLDAVRP